MDGICRGCGNAATKVCSGCHKAWFCSQECQRRQWPLHIFDCNPPRPPNTAHKLGLAAHQNVVPEDRQTRIDYRFEKCRSDDDESRLLGLYQALIKNFGIQPSAMHRARVKGRLVEKAKKRYERIPAENRRIYHPWFLDNLYLLDGSAPPLPTVYFESEADHLSVRDLVALLAGETKEVIPSVGVDYGFYNCKEPEEILYLKKSYISYFQNRVTRPEYLHEAAIAGKLFGHVSQYVSMAPENIPIMKRVMQNPYPLPDE